MIITCSNYCIFLKKCSLENEERKYYCHDLYCIPSVLLSPKIQFLYLSAILSLDSFQYLKSSQLQYLIFHPYHLWINDGKKNRDFSNFRTCSISISRSHLVRTYIMANRGNFQGFVALPDRFPFLFRRTIYPIKQLPQSLYKTSPDARSITSGGNYPNYHLARTEGRTRRESIRSQSKWFD